MSSSVKEAAKTRRLLELYLYLSNVGAPVGRERIRANVEGYRGLGDEAFERQFERDKKDFRSLGVEIATTSDDGSDVPARYRIVPRAVALPALDLTAAEMAALQVARGLWHQADLFAQASGAVRKLVRDDVVLADTPFAGLSPRSAGPEPAFEDLRRALRSRTVVTFRYRSAGGTATVQRRVQPWQLLLRHGAAYLRGYDLDRGAQRVFRLSRMIGPVHRSGSAGAYEIPDLEGTGILGPGTLPEPVRVLVAVAPGRGQALRAAGTPHPGGCTGTPEGWDVLQVPARRTEAVVDLVISHGADAVILGPDDAREDVVARLTAVAAGRR